MIIEMLHGYFEVRLGSNAPPGGVKFQAKYGLRY